MRQIVLDTETTGLSPASGHRIIEIGCVELVNRRLTGNNFHYYLQPDRKCDPGAVKVHGITDDFLKDKPRFKQISDEFFAYIDKAELIIHNAPFDVGFIEHEYSLLQNDFGKLNQYCKIIDTLTMARKKYPGQKNNLDALCKRLSVDTYSRDFHGALLDAQILADVYLLMTGGQTTINFDATPKVSIAKTKNQAQKTFDLPVIKANSDELALHQEFLEKLDSTFGE